MVRVVQFCKFGAEQFADGSLARHRPVERSPQASQGRASPCVRPHAYAARPATVVLAGRATTVPFTAVVTGRSGHPRTMPQHRDLRRSSSDQMATLPDLALQAGGRLSHRLLNQRPEVGAAGRVRPAARRGQPGGQNTISSLPNRSKVSAKPGTPGLFWVNSRPPVLVSPLPEPGSTLTAPAWETVPTSAGQQACRLRSRTCPPMLVLQEAPLPARNHSLNPCLDALEQLAFHDEGAGSLSRIQKAVSAATGGGGRHQRSSSRRRCGSGWLPPSRCTLRSGTGYHYSNVASRSSGW